MRNMTFLLIPIAAMLALLPARASADDWVFTVPDYKGMEPCTYSKQIDTRIEIDCTIPYFGWRVTIDVNDRITAEITVPVPVFVPTYIVFSSSSEDPFDPNSDSIILTDVWAKDLQPELDPNLIPALTGFNPGSPEFIPLSKEKFRGISGTWYDCNAVTCRLDDLATRLPGYDLSFFQGDPNSIVYVAQRHVPASDFVTIPEPCSLALLGGGGLSLILRRRK